MQDEIVARLANALNTQLVAAEARRAEQAPTPDSMDLYFQGLAWSNRGTTPENVSQARGFFDRALAADPDNVDALIGLARTDLLEGASFFVADPAAAPAELDAREVATPSGCDGPRRSGRKRHRHRRRSIRGGRGEIDQSALVITRPCARACVLGPRRTIRGDGRAGSPPGSHPGNLGQHS
jgi:hypothetical protein